MNPMFRNLLFGTIVSGILLGAVAAVVLRIFFPEIFLAGMAGFGCGVLYAIIQLVHMYRGILVTLDYREEKSATWHSRKMYAIRLVAVFAVFFAAWQAGGVYAIAFTIPGMMTLKVAAYMQLQPFTDKLFHAVFRDETVNK